MIFVFLLLLAVTQVFAQQETPIYYRLSHPIATKQKDNIFLKKKNINSSSAEFLHVVGIMVDFQADDDDATTGDGKFDTSHTAKKIIDPSPHDSSYFDDHLHFAQNYFRKVSNGKLLIDYKVFGNVVHLPKKMRAYSSKKTSTNFYELDTLMLDAWSRADSLIDFSQFDSNNTAFIIFHAGVGRDIDLASAYGYDIRPFDIPTIYRSLKNLQKNFGDDYLGIPVEGGAYHIKNSLILPETESRYLPSSFGGDVFVQFGLNGMLCGNIGSHLGLPDLFNTKKIGRAHV